MSEGHRGPGKVLGVEEVEGGLALDLGGDVARHGGDPVVSVDDAAIRKVASQVLVLDSLDQTQLRDRPGEKMIRSSSINADGGYMTALTCHAPAASRRQTRPCWTAWSCGPRGACAGTGRGPRGSGASPSPGCRMNACKIKIGSDWNQKIFFESL